MKQIKILLTLNLVFTILSISFNNKIYSQKYYELNNTANTVDYSVAKNVEPSLMLPNIREVIERGYLKVVMVPNDIDVFCHTTDDNKIVGLDVNLARQIASLLGVKLRIFPVKEYSDIIPMLKDKKVDMGIAIYSSNVYRSASINLSNPYLNSKLCVTVNAKELAKNNIKNNPIDYMKENRVKIGVLKGSIHTITAKNVFPKAEIIEIETQDDIVEAILNNEIFAIFQGQIECLNDYISKPNLTIYVKSFIFSDASDKFCVALPADNLDMLNFINAYFLSRQPLSVKDVEEACKEFYNY